MSIVQNMKITCRSFVFDTFVFSLDYCRIQGRNSRKYFRVPVDDVPDAENMVELLRDAVHFICEMKYLKEFSSLLIE